MQKIINTGDLPEEEVKLIADFIEFFKTRKEKEVKKEREDITFITWHLEVKGKLRREEISDLYL